MSIKDFATSSKTSIILVLTFLAIITVLFRMKSVELDYKVTDQNRKLEKSLIENKSFKADRAS